MALGKRIVICFILNYIGITLAEDSTTITIAVSSNDTVNQKATSVTPSVANLVSVIANIISDATTPSGANVSGANVSEANVSGANVSVAIVSGANESEANVSGANVSEANVSGANVSEATTIKTKSSSKRKEKPVTRSEKKSQNLKSSVKKPKLRSQKNRPNHAKTLSKHEQLLRVAKSAQYFSPGVRPKNSLRYGFQHTSACKDFEKAFLCVRKCLDHGFDVSYADKKCKCRCFKNRDKGQYTRPRKHNTTKWLLGTPTTKKPYWAQPKTEEPSPDDPFRGKDLDEDPGAEGEIVENVEEPAENAQPEGEGAEGGQEGGEEPTEAAPEGEQDGGQPPEAGAEGEQHEGEPAEAGAEEEQHEGEPAEAGAEEEQQEGEPAEEPQE